MFCSLPVRNSRHCWPLKQSLVGQETEPSKMKTMHSLPWNLHSYKGSGGIYVEFFAPTSSTWPSLATAPITLSGVAMFCSKNSRSTFGEICHFIDHYINLSGHCGNCWGKGMLNLSHSDRSFLVHSPRFARESCVRWHQSHQSPFPLKIVRSGDSAPHSG